VVAVPPLAVSGFVVERVNGTRETVRPGGSAAQCRAIFVTAIEVRLRARLPRSSSTRATLVATYPGHVIRRHALRLRTRRGTTRVVLRAADERLPGRDFAAGTYRFALRAAGHRASAKLTLTGAMTC
jgi:hypothetical protein